ncbi:MAG: fibronectin type III domain-containing protein [Imperialibacter sp.]|uniref:fibronectin type III domain-containing protein n=1 Tax=Imperialibacter sp. TaxID=2038411 RepID=UPI003A85A603
MKRNLRYYLLLACTVLLYEGVQAQLVQTSQTTSNGGGSSTGTNIQHFGVAGQSVAGGASGGNYQMNIGFIHTIANDAFPQAPSDFLVLPLSETSLHISWIDNANNETHYALERSTSDDFTTDLVGIPVGANGTEYTNAGLTPDTYYFYRLKAVGASEESDYVYDGAATFSGTLDDRWAWASSLNSPSYGRTVANDNNGNTYVGGRVDADLFVGAESWVVSGGSDGFVIKYDADGNIVWGRQLLSNSGASVEEVKVDANGVLYVSGYFSGQLTIPNGPTFNSQGSTDGFLLKMDTNGQLIWAKSLGGSLNDLITSHAFDGSGNIHLLYSSSSVNGTFGGSALNAGLHIVTISPNGNFVRTRPVSAESGVSGNDLAVDAQGNIYVVGGFSGAPSIAGVGLSVSGTIDIYYAKFNNSGDPLWVKQASTPENDIAYAVAVNGSNVYVGGFFDGSSLVVPTISPASSAGGREGFLLAASSANGDTQWIRTMGGAGSDGILAMATGSSGQIVVSGFMGIDQMLFPPSAETLSNGFGFFAHYDASGAVLRVDKVEGKSNYLVSNRAVSVFENNLYATGRFLGAAEFGQLTTLNSGGSAAMFVGKYKYQEICDTPVSFTVSNVTSTTADLSWNIAQYPAGDALTYKIRYKPLGTLTWEEVIQGETTLQLTALEPGVQYLVQVNMTCTGSEVLTSAYTDVESFTTLGAPACEVPVVASDVSISDTEQDITWNNTGAVTYDVRYRLKGTTIWTTTTGLVSASASLTGLQAGMVYQIQVRGVCAAVQTLYSSVYEFTTSGAVSCPVPAGMSVSGITASSATVSWTDQSAESYEIRYKPNGTAIWTTTGTAAASIDLTDLEPGTDYVYMLKAVCNSSSGLSSVYSTVNQFTTTGAPSCVTPVGLSATVTTNSADISWTASTGAVAYDIRYRVQGTTVWNYVQSPTNSKQLTGLSGGTSYQVQARSVCTLDGTFVSVYSTTYIFTTQGAAACTTPAGLVATPGTTDASLTWAAQGGAFSYQVRYRLEGTTTWSYQTTATNSLNVSSLVSGMPYMWTVRTICNAEGTLASPFASMAFFETTGVVSCEVPTNLLVSAITDQSANLSWSDVGATSYQIRYRIAGTPIWTMVPVVSPSYVLTGLESGMPYQVQVKAICAVDGSVQSLFSSLVSFETSGTVSCEIPVNLAASNITSSSATVSWTTVAEAASGYGLRYRVKGTSLWTLVTTGTNIYNLTGLEPGMPYQFSVKSNCSTNPVLSSVYSVPAEFTTDGLPSCDVPSGFNVSAADTDAEITWANLGSLSYDVRFRVSGSTIWTNLNVGTNAISLGSLQTGTNYQFQVRSVCAANGSLKSLYSGVEFFTTTGTVSCESPTGLAASAITDTGAQVTWTVAAGVDQYDVRYRVKGTTIWTQVLAGTASVSLSGLSSGMPYQVRVRTLCAPDNSLVSPYSSIMEFSTTGATACAVPTGLTVGVTEQTTADLSWGAASGALSYEVLYRKQGDIIWTAATSATASISLSGLTSLTTYQWKVRTICSGDNSLRSQFSSVSTFQTIAEPGARVAEEDDTEIAMGLEEVLAAFELVIYPNPSPDQVFFRLIPPQSDYFSLSVFNLAGQEVQHLFDGWLEGEEQAEFIWQGRDRPSGIYVFKLSNGKGLEISRRIILTH